MANNLVQRAQQATSGAVVGRPMGVEDNIKAMMPQFQLAMPKGAEAAQLVRDALTVMRQNPKLAEANQASLLGSLMTCAQLGLRPGIGVLGHAYIIPFKGQAQLIIGYQGMLELANRADKIERMVARAVHKNDLFEIDYGNDVLTHSISTTEARGEIVGYYAKFHHKGSPYPTFEYMSKPEVEAHRDKFAMQRYQGKVSGPWAQHFDAMALKTVVRKLFKWMPRSTEIQNALIADETIRVTAKPDDDLVQVTEGVDFDHRGHNAIEDPDSAPAYSGPDESWNTP